MSKYFHLKTIDFYITCAAKKSTEKKQRSIEVLEFELIKTGRILLNNDFL